MDLNNEAFPFEIEDVEEGLAKELMDHFTGEKTGFVKVEPKGYFFPHKYKEEAVSIYNLPIKQDDVFVISFPRSGTTLTQELVWLIHNDLDYERAKSTKLYQRFPMMEFSVAVHPETARTLSEDNKDVEDSLKYIDNITTPIAERMAKLPSPRFIKTHIALSLLPPKLLDTAKVVYVARDPRDVAVSLYHLFRLLAPINAVKDFKTHWNYFIQGLVYWGPYFEHVKEAWNMREHPNMLFLLYEEITNDMPAVVRRVAKFFGKSYTDKQVQELCDHLSFDKFKSNSSVTQVFPIRNFYKSDAQPFLRKGKVGGWSDYFDDEMQLQAECWMTDNLLDTDLRFPTFHSS